MFRYEINGGWYTQSPIVLGQMAQLSKIFTSVNIGEIEELKDLIETLGDRLPELMAVVLTPEGTHLKDKNMKAMIDEMENYATLEVVESVVTDFFPCNPNVLSLLEKVDKATGMIGEMLGKVMLKFLSSSYVSSFQEAISQSETTSSGESESTK